jgi:hypothetical protein
MIYHHVWIPIMGWMATPRKPCFDHCFRYFQGLSSFEWRFPSLRVGIIPMESLEAGMGYRKGLLRYPREATWFIPSLTHL